MHVLVQPRVQAAGKELQGVAGQGVYALGVYALGVFCVTPPPQPPPTRTHAHADNPAMQRCAQSMQDRKSVV